MAHDETGFTRRVFTAEDQRRINKVYVDMYEGDGKENPSMTSRMSLLEDTVEKLNSNLGRLVWLGVATLVTVFANLLFHR